MDPQAKNISSKLASLGAALTILSLTFDPFLQLLVNYPAENHEDANGASIPYAQGYSKGEERESGVLGEVIHSATCETVLHPWP